MKELQRQADPNIVIALAGNKLDKAEDRQIPAEEANAYAKEQGLFFLETSAKTNHNVTEIFKIIARHVPKSEPKPESSFVIDPDIIPEKKNKSCKSPCFVGVCVCACVRACNFKRTHRHSRSPLLCRILFSQAAKPGSPHRLAVRPAYI